jgi:hypothetical protein
MKGENFTKLGKENVKFAISRFTQMFLEGLKGKK